MAEMITRKLPAGIQFFSIIRKEGYLYVDKTNLVWQLTHSGDLYNYLSRPRRFGKSLLIDTLQCYFEGKKELFEGLKIMELEEEWTEYPIIRLDMSGAGATAAEIKDYLNLEFSKYEALYSIKPKETSRESVRFQVILDTAYQKTGKQVVVLIDEYDSPCSIHGRHQSMKVALKFIVLYSPYSNSKEMYFALSSSQASRSLPRYPYSLYLTI